MVRDWKQEAKLALACNGQRKGNSMISFVGSFAGSLVVLPKGNELHSKRSALDRPQPCVVDGVEQAAILYITSIV